MERTMLIFSFKGVQEDMILLHSFKVMGCHLTNLDSIFRQPFLSTWERFARTLEAKIMICPNRLLDSD